MGDRLRPSNPWRRCLNGEHLSSACRHDLSHVIGAAPFRGQEEQRRSVRAAKRATEYRAVVLDPAQDFTAPPLAVVELPVRVPFGFHGSWIPDRP